MRNYLVKELVSEIYEGRLEILDNETAILLDKIDLYTSIIDIKYEDKLRDMELINSIKAYNDEIKNLIDKINEVGLAAIKNKNDKLLFQCESRKAHLINLMIYLQEKYL